MRNSKFQIRAGKDDQRCFHLRAANGEVILNSEAYTAKSDCQNGIASVKENTPSGERCRRKTTSNGQYYFVLIVPTHVGVNRGTSGPYQRPGDFAHTWG
jgi:uncharacterized protein YegP (UPF0339 family)